MDGRRGGTAGRARLAMLVAPVAALALTGCVGSITHQDLQNEMRERGGGIGPRLVTGAIEAVRDELGTDSVELRSLDLDPGRATMEVRVPGRADELDTYTYGTSGLLGSRGLDGPHPVRVSASGPPLESQVFAADQAGLDRFGDMVDDARAQADLRDGYVESARVARGTDGPAPVITVVVTDERNRVTTTFAPDGSLIGTEQA